MNLRVLLLLFIFSSCYNSERNCKKFQTGTFEFESISNNGDTLVTKFKRTKDLEIGYFNNIIDSSYVNWVSFSVNNNDKIKRYFLLIILKR